MAKTKIEWCDETRNPITGCTPISVGCQHCYAARMAQRLKGRFGYPAENPFQPGIVHHDVFQSPKFPKKPSKIFLCSMGDLFHENVKSDDQTRVFRMIGSYPEHTFLLLTKRPKNMFQFFNQVWKHDWPQNAWAGVTVEKEQPEILSRIAWLAEIPTQVRFISAEPMLSGLPLQELNVLQYLDWVICGGETGPKARPCHIEWVRDLRDQCVAAKIPFFFKKFKDGVTTIDGREWRQFPK